MLALHQMACGASWAEDSIAWDRVSAHLVVKRSGVVQMNHDPLARITVGSGPHWNPTCVTVEFAGNLPTSVGRDGSWAWWKPETHGRDLLTPEQVEAGRALADPEARKAQYAIVQEAFGRDVPYIWTGTNQFAVITPTEVMGIADFTLPDGTAGTPVVSGIFFLKDVWRAS